MGKKANKKRQKDQRGYATTSSTPAAAASSKNKAKNVALSNVKNGEAASASSSTALSHKSTVSSQNHQDLLHLLGSLDDDDASSLSPTGTSTTWISPDRFYKKLYNIHDTLDQLGFSYENIGRVVAALGYSITLENSLDWLCLHLSTEDLPPLLTEGTVREKEQSARGKVSNDASLVVLKPTIRPKDFEEDERKEEIFPSVLSLASNPEPEEASNEPTTLSPEKEKQQEAAKAWILQQYQYEEEHEGEDETEGKDDVASSSHPQQQPAEPPKPSPKPTPDAEPIPMDPQEEKLVELEKQLKEQEADANDEASNYMRSKQEIKELKTNCKKLRQQVQGLRKKIAKTRAAREVAVKEEVAATNGGDEEEHSGGIFATDNGDEEEEEEGAGLFASFFDGSTPSAAAESKVEDKKEEKELPPPSDPVVPSDSVPKGWTGKTPREILEDWCKKEKFRRPQFFKLPVQNGARIRVDIKPSPISMQTDNYMGSYMDAQQYLSTKVLYQLNPDLPLYRLFPPYYRDLWRSWSESVQDEKDAQQREVDEAISSKVQKLVDSVPKPNGAHSKRSAVANTRKVTEDSEATNSRTEDTILDSWEDDDGTNQTLSSFVPSKPESDSKRNGVESSAPRTSVGPTRSGLSIKEQFIRRQQTPAYRAMLEVRTSLPMYDFREQLLKAIRDNPVTILCAETGAGKTTQCPQFILEDAFASGTGDKVSILCTQPRRVAATSVAERVSDEMAEKAIGETVGYQIRLEAKRSAKTRLLFCTTGVVLRRLQDDPLLTGITHVCVDEVHERQYQVDCLLVMLRQLLKKGRPDLKVILMSATLDAKLFTSFFGGAPLFDVPGRTFPVSVYHLEDLMDGTDHIIEEGSRYALREDRSRGGTASIEISTRGGEKRKEVHSLESGGVHLSDVPEDFYPGYKMSTRRSMGRVNEEIINYDLIEDVLHMILVEPGRNDTLLPPEGSNLATGSVLVFLPGFGEIRSLTERLEGSRSLGNKQLFDIIPMHSSLSPQDQRRAFLSPKRGCRKIILSTNIAETSVTIPDVVCVLDAGRVREVRVDKRTSTSRLVTDWCSRASAKQRAGRAGRVQPGICLKLYSSRTASIIMNEASQPEIRRVPLEDVCLSILAGSFAANCMEFLIQTPQPPAEEAVRSALRILHDVGAIKMVDNEATGKTSEQLTPLGKHLSRLPVDVRLGKMLIFGSLFKCVNPVLTVASCLSCKTPFSAFVNDALQAKAKHKLFAHENSDFLTLCNVWDAYEKALTEGGMSRARNFCYENYLSFSSLREISDTRRHFVELLFGIGFLDKRQLGSEDGGRVGAKSSLSKALLSSPYNANQGNIDVVHSVCCAGLYPNVSHLIPNPSGSGERQLWHKNEQLFFHSASVNSKLKTTNRYPTSWIAFHEKFGTQHRVSVSTTCFVHPFAILVFGGDLVVKHTERRVIVDDWIEIPMAAQTGVMFREVRRQVEKVLQSFLQVDRHKGTPGLDDKRRAMVDGVVRLLSIETEKK